MRFLWLILTLVSGIGLSACDVVGLSNHSKDYVKNSNEIPPIVVPPTVPSVKNEPYYVIPKVADNNIASRSVSLEPPTLSQK